jgi:hypothetical protein
MTFLTSGGATTSGELHPVHRRESHTKLHALMRAWSGFSTPFPIAAARRSCAPVVRRP